MPSDTSRGPLPRGEAAALRAVVRGRVQGVGFRDYVYTRARFLGLTGYVRNLPDSRSLEVVAEGRRQDLEQLLEYLRDGPRTARVDAIDAEWGEAIGHYNDFGVAF
ncbi:MAG: acylphosphatase [Chloroflexi bacterium]|nr:acylphosphatase [Chloroflexota bacterium]